MAFAGGVNFVVGFVMFARSVASAVATFIGGVSSISAPNGTGLLEPLPRELPSIVDIKRALPKRCFQPLVSISMYYAVRDLVQVAVTFAVFAYMLEWRSPPLWARVFLVLLYWAIQGTFFTSIFVIGHDCGHGSFSEYSLLNDIVGTVMHAFLVCPYYMWKLSHRRHHQFNANFDKDEVFYPVKKTEECSKSKVLPAFGLGVGWFGYLVMGYHPRPVRHFNPFDSMFVGHVVGCLFTLASLAVAVYLLHMFYLVFGVIGLIVYYVVPLFIFSCYMVTITFLHHHEVNIPWYADDKWDFVRGQLSSIDRHYGIVHNIIHSIGTHQMHHMFAHIPHYRLEEATTHFRAAFPDLVRACDEPILPSFVRMFLKYDKQSVIAENTQVHYYK